MDAEWFSRYLAEEVASVDWSDAPLDAGFMSAVRKVRVTTKTGAVRSPVLKKVQHDGPVNDLVALGCTREADFYNFWAEESTRGTDKSTRGTDKSSLVDEALADILPRVFFAESDATSGEKTLLLEDLSASGGVNSTYFFGPASPMNWTKDLTSLTAPFPDVTPVEIARRSFVALARIHARFWERKELEEFEWLSGMKWRKGEGKEEWKGLKEKSAIPFERIKSWIEAGTYPHEIPSGLFRCLISAFEGFTWENFRDQSAKSSWTLIHGDFHPGNVMWLPNDPCLVKLFDWEFVGLGSGPLDLGQYVISHMDVDVFGKDVHSELVIAYYEELTRLDPKIRDSYSFSRCWEEFVHAGFRRWLWMLPTVETWCPEAMPYFIRQMEGFRRIHGIGETSVGCPIV